MYLNIKTLDTFKFNVVTLSTLLKYACFITGFVFLVIFFRLVAPIGYDWQHSFYPAVQNPMRYKEVSEVVWLPITLFFLPHGRLSLEWSNAVNQALNAIMPAIVLYRYKAPKWTYFLIYLSPALVYNICVNNIGWIPLLGFVMADRWGIVLLAAKPQAIGGAALIWLKKQGVFILVPVLIIMLLMVAIWGTDALKNDRSTDVIFGWWNVSPFPVLVPVGLYLLLKAWKEENMFMAAAATPCLMPYVGTTSIVTIITVLACKYPREAGYLVAAIWAVVAIYVRLSAF